MVMTTGTASGGPILRPEQVGDLVVTPVTEQSIATQVATVVTTSSHDYRIPLITADPAAQWVAEGDEITPSDADSDEITVTPRKLAGLTIITRELANDSDPAAAEAVGDGLARDMARRLDEAFFGNLATPAPPGLGSIAPTVVLGAGTDWANVDPFADALSRAEGLSAAIGSWVANPADALALAQIKESTGSNKPLLQPDPTQPTRRTIQGVPLYVSPHVTAGDVWGIPKGRVFVVIREDAEVESSAHTFFTSDRVAVRATMRVGFGFPHVAAVMVVRRDAV